MYEGLEPVDRDAELPGPQVPKIMAFRLGFCDTRFCLTTSAVQASSSFIVLLV